MRKLFKVLFILAIVIIISGIIYSLITSSNKVDFKAMIEEINELKYPNNKEVSLFAGTEALDLYMLKSQYDMDKNKLFDDCYINRQQIIIQSSMYAIVKPKFMQKAKAKIAMDDFFKKAVENMAKMPNQKAMLDKKLIKEQKGYLIYIVSENNEAVEQVINKYIKE